MVSLHSNRTMTKTVCNLFGPAEAWAFVLLSGMLSHCAVLWKHTLVCLRDTVVTVRDFSYLIMLLSNVLCSLFTVISSKIFSKEKGSFVSFEEKHTFPPQKM